MLTVNLMVWGMILLNGEHRLVMADETSNANAYINILDENLLEFDGVKV
jgi:hypothetical protein